MTAEQATNMARSHGFDFQWSAKSKAYLLTNEDGNTILKLFPRQLEVMTLTKFKEYVK